MDAKEVIYEGFTEAAGRGVPREAAGVLVDEQYGASVARKARSAGDVLAMPVEKSGQAEFEFQYGDEFGLHIEEFDPVFAKVLVRYNPDGDRELNRPADRAARPAQQLAARPGPALPVRAADPADARPARPGGRRPAAVRP